MTVAIPPIASGGGPIVRTVVDLAHWGTTLLVFFVIRTNYPCEGGDWVARSRGVAKHGGAWPWATAQTLRHGHRSARHHCLLRRGRRRPRGDDATMSVYRTSVLRWRRPQAYAVKVYELGALGPATAHAVR